MGSRGSLVGAIGFLALSVSSMVRFIVGNSDDWWLAGAFGIVSAYWFWNFTSARRDERWAKLARRAVQPPA